MAKYRMRKKIIAGIILGALCMLVPMAYMIAQEDFRKVEVGIPAKILFTALFMTPTLSLLLLNLWFMKKHGEFFDLLTEWWR